MAESSGGRQSDNWKCVNPKCGYELVRSMRFCPECGTKQNQVSRCVQCSVELKNSTDTTCHVCKAPRPGRKPLSPFMAESSTGGRQSDNWKCVNPECGYELPGNIRLRFCPECLTEQKQKAPRCVQCSVELKNSTDTTCHVCKASRPGRKPLDSSQEDPSTSKPHTTEEGTRLTSQEKSQTSTCIAAVSSSSTAIDPPSSPGPGGAAAQSGPPLQPTQPHPEQHAPSSGDQIPTSTEGNKTPSPPSAPLSEEHKNDSALTPQEKQSLPTSAAPQKRIAFEESPTQETTGIGKDGGSDPDKAALVTGRPDKDDKEGDAGPPSDNAPNSTVPKLGLKQVFGTVQGARSTKEGEATLSGVKAHQQHERQKQMDKQREERKELQQQQDKERKRQQQQKEEERKKEIQQREEERMKKQQQQQKEEQKKREEKHKQQQQRVKEKQEEQKKNELPEKHTGPVVTDTKDHPLESNGSDSGGQRDSGGGDGGDSGDGGRRASASNTTTANQRGGSPTNKVRKRTQFPDPPQAKRRRWSRKRVRQDHDTDQYQLHSSLKHLRSYASSEENESFIAADSASSSGEEMLEAEIYRKRVEPENLFSGTRGKEKKPSVEKKMTQTEKGQAARGNGGKTEQKQKYDHQNHPRPNTDLRGLNAKRERSITVTFHCILPKLLWEWDEASSMHMRFEGPDLGHWKHNVGECKQGRQLYEGVFEMTCRLVIDADLLKGPFGYKYVVYSPKMVNENDCFEYLHSYIGRDYHHRNPNRCLRINPAEFDSVYGGEYHQYDFFVYPEATKIEKSVFSHIMEFGKGILTFFKKSSTRQGEEKEEHFTPVSTEAMARQCLPFYLEPYKAMLLSDGEYPKDFRVDDFVKQVGLIYSMHIKQWVQHHGVPSTAPPVQPIKEDVKKWLEEVVVELQNCESPKSQFVSSVCIACCSVAVDCYQRDLKLTKFVYPLLKMLHIQPNVENRSCPKVSYLFDIITTKKFREKVNFAILRLCKKAMISISNWELDWLSVLPLCHFLSGSCEPFASLEYNPENIQFNARAKEFGYVDVRQKLSLGLVNHFYSSLEPLFTADPLLLYAFIYICPKEDFQHLFQKIPAYLSLTWLSYWPVPFTRESAKEWNVWLDCVVQKISLEPTEKQLTVATVDAAKLLVKYLFGKLTGTFNHHLDVLKASISLLLIVLCKTQVLVSKNVMDESNATDVLGMCELTLRGWVADHNVIGGSFFGGTVHNSWIGSKKELVYALPELKLWKNMLSLQVPQERKVAEAWNECIKRVIKRRVDKVPSLYIMELVCVLEKDENVHPMLSTLFMEKGMQAVDELFTKNHYGNLDSFGESRRFGELFGRLLERKYPQIGTEESITISLDDLLGWSYWPDFIKIYSGTSKAKEGLPLKCHLACSFAISQLDEVSRQLQEGEITVQDLQKIQAGHDQMKRLCEAANAKQKEDKSKQKSGQMLYDALSRAVKLRLGEFETFKEQQGFLLHLCQRIHPPIKGISEAREELQMEYKSCKINTLCTRRESSIDIVCFTTAHCLLSFAWKFDVMTKRFISSIFDATWSTAVKKVRANNPDMSISDVEKQVWTPTFEHCQNLLEQLSSQTMHLADVDRHFKDYRVKLESELKVLFRGVNQCLHQNHDDDWIHHTVLRIEEYRKLRGYCDAANSFLKLRDSLKLTKGDFRNVERISKEVSSSMKDQTLDDINEELIGAGEFLSGFTGDKLECIEKFSECQNIVQWIRDTTKDVSDLQNFVNVALATAAGGEDDFANDRLSSLRTVGSGFGSLIYKLKEDTGFQGLAERCSSVWTAYENNSNLPTMLADCNKDLEWYKSVKETQGSVEVTSFGQMDNIQSYGLYTIAGKRDTAMHSIHDVIQLTLFPQKEKKLIKTSYSLDELRDLESKLVLITGSKAENRAAVEQFLNTLHSVCRIAEVLIRLQQVGNVKYIGWRMQFRCQTLLVEDLQEQAKDMEDELESWNKEVTTARKEFYELNYYTTRQLLVLRSELGKMKSLGPATPPPQQAQVMALLQSISSEITPRIVESVVQQVISQFTDDWRSLDVPESPIPESRQASCADIEPLMDTSFLPSPTMDQFGDILPSEEQLHSHPAKAAHVKSLPRVSLSQETLNEKQSEQFTNIIEKYGYCEITSLKAIEEVGDSDWNEIQNWLEENGDKYEELFQEAEGQDEEEEEEEEEAAGESSEGEEMCSESEASNRNQDDSFLGVPPSQSPHVSPSSSHSQSRVVVTHTQPVDETNDQVQLLLEAEMGTPEECIRAIEAHGTAQIAMDHMMEVEEGALFEDVSVPMQYGVEECAVPIQTTDIGIDEIRIIVKDRVEDQYLKLEELGEVLRQLSHEFPATVQRKRKFESTLKPGQPHLLVVCPELVLRAALSLYMEETNLPMPTPEEMLICNQHTTTEEVNLLWQRAVCDPEFKRIFCLVHAEKLSYQTADKALRSLTDIIQGKAGYRLVIICSSQEEEKSPIISKLHLYRRPYGVPGDITRYRAYFKSHFVDEDQPSYQQLQTPGSVLHLTASVVDPDRSCVRVVLSTRAGMGKTLFVTRMAEKLQPLVVGCNMHITIPIHGPQVTTDSVMQYLVNHQNTSLCTILHFDISPSVLWQVDTILFSLLVQRGLCDSQGRVWRNDSSQLYAIEVTLPEPQPTEKQSIPERFTLAVLEMLPCVNCIKPKDALPLMTHGVPDGNIVMDEEEFKSEAYQRVYQYLRRHVSNHNLDRFSYSKGSTEGSPDDCLQIILRYCGVKDPSWAEIRHFVKFLDLQLQSCERSIFCNEDFVGDVMAGLKSFVVKFMIRMSRDFSTSSLRGEVAQENEEVGHEEDVLGQYEIVERKQWEQSSHPYIFFNQDRISITFVGFMVTSNGDLIDPAHRGGTLERSIMTQQLYTGLKQQRVNFDDDYRKWTKAEMIEKISMVMGIQWPYDPDDTYVLTVDNLIKILAIQMRFRCGIPVVIMGETGCGKTRLIRFMCDLTAQGSGKGNMLILKVHGGISEEDIKKFIEKAEDKAKENRSRNLDTVVFFDEANTTEAIGLIKEIMCDRRLHGKSISQDLKFIAACNPYRRHSRKMIDKLRSAGLGFYVRETDTQQKLGKIPLRELVYRVIDLPPSMRPLVYDFGQLNTDTERDYTSQIVHDHVKKHTALSQQHTELIPAVARVLAWSQRYMRERKDECSFVSLRDVERAMLVFTYFFEKMPLFRGAMNERERVENAAERRLAPAPIVAQDPDIFPAMIPVEFVAPVATDISRDLTRSLILAVSVCYHARLSDRKDFEEKIAQQFTAHLTLSGGVEQFRNEIRWCQEVLLESMVLGENIARNAALRENVFMMAVCVDLRIPLFLVGKPGSSKSLAKAIVADSMRGQASQNDLLKSFKQVHMFSYQCSQLSTPQSVIEVFNTAKKFQKNQDTTKYVSVVVLDEVGLAEDSRNLPLKALHPLLEDGTEGADDNMEVVERSKRVAFIGISNWALDPAKMNRGVMVTRGDPDTNELVVSAHGICHKEENDEVRRRLSHYFEFLASAYNHICENQKRQFFGLRDFYSLIKMLYWMCKKTEMPPTGPQLVHAIKRNFGGMKDENLDPEMIFRKMLPISIDSPPDLSNIDPEIQPFVNPDNSRRGLIKTSLKTKETSWHGENRYLLFLTENYAALEILKQYLQDAEGDLQLYRSRPEEATLKPWEMEPFVLFGSSFPRDKEYTQVCRNINQIKICMEIGRTVILLNLENLYESLYDVLNQYYIHHGGIRYVDLGLQTHKVKCRVHEEFKLILIAEKTTVYDEFPTPLINRLEKHFVLYSSVLEEWQSDTLEQLEEWIKTFSHVSSSNSSFKEKDAFVGYQKDVAAAVVFQASSQLRKYCGRWREGDEYSSGHQLWETAWKSGLLGDCPLYKLVDEEEGSDQWKQAVLLISQFLLLQTSPPHALVRLLKTDLKAQHKRLNLLYETQHHTSIDDFLIHHMSHDHSRGGLLLQVTTNSHLLSSDEVDELSKVLCLDGRTYPFLLQEFDTELDFTSKVSPLFVRGENSQGACLLIILCDSGHINGDLIACARYRIYDMRAKDLLSQLAESQSGHVTHVLFIINLPVQAVQSSFVGFQGDPWVSCHIDELRASEKGAITLEGAQGITISELFYGGPEQRRRREPVLERQVSDFTSSVEGMVFERMRSEEGGWGEVEMEEGREVEGDMQVMDIENEEETKSSSDSGEEEKPMEEPMEERERVSEEDDITDKEGPLRSAGSVTVMQEDEAAVNTERVVLGEKFSEMCKQCVRLNSCIQAAASRLQDSMLNKQRAAERVKLLIKFIPLKPLFPLEPDSFYAILVSHLRRILRERESVYQDRNWVLNEAMDIHRLQTGGTFKNVLTRKLDDIVVPFFAEIIAFVDRNCNLSLLQTERPITPLSEFWLKIFRSERAEQALHFTDIVATQKVPMRDEEFTCEFPFSWLVKELMDAQWDTAQSTGGSSTQQVHRQLCAMVSDTSLGEILMSIEDGGQCEELYRRYIHDFVRSVHKCTHKKAETLKHEYKLIQDTLHNMVVRGHDFSSLDGHMTLTNRIAAVHVVYRATGECIHWFGQLTSHSPGILAGMVQSAEQTVGEDEGMMLHLYAVERVLSGLKPPIEANRQSNYSDDQTLRQWLNHLQKLSNAIESTLSLPSKHPLAVRARLKWQKIRAIQMFTEHVLLNHGNMITYARRLNITFGEETDFLKCVTVEKVKRALNNMHGTLKKEHKSKDQKKQLTAIRKSCRNFFIEVVSGLCFGQSSPPEDNLVEMLLNIVFTERGDEGEEGGDREGGKWGTRDLTPYKEDLKERDKNPIIRSFLLQLLLEHNTEKVKGHLRNYFDRSQQALVGGDQDLCLLCTQCFEDALDKDHSSQSLKHQMRAASELLTSAMDTLTRSTGFSHRAISLDVLEGVAKMRYALFVVAKLLQLQINEMGGALASHTQKLLYGSVASNLLEEAKHACTADRINTIDTSGKSNTTGPIVYLLKLLARQSGFSCLKKIAEGHNWVIPPELCRTETERTVDPFVIYNPVYSSIREEMSATAYGRDYAALEERTVALQPQECVPLLLSVYEIFTMSRASTQPSRQLLPVTIEKMNEMILNCKALLRELKVMARALVSNEQGGPLAALQVSAGQPSSHRTLGAVVVHTAATLLSRRGVDLLHPLVALLSTPGDMAGSYLPTMAEDMLPEARRIITGGQFYECPNGHPYFVGECGRPMVQATCNVCGSAIGGQNHRQVSSNRVARITDSTQTGHSLGHPTARGGVPSPERSLSPAACCILRAIMHSALLWASCNNDTAIEGLLRLVRSGLRGPQELPEFFWGHLEKDVELLARALGKNHQEAAIVVHLVLQNILTSDPSHNTLTPALRTLGARNARDEWEKQFGQNYIHPLLEKLEGKLGDAMGAILNDDKQDHDPLFYLVYERVPVVEGSLEPHLWGYRPCITLEHLTRYMQQQKTKYPLLKEFLKEEAVLRATQYLPDLVQLQRRMFDEFHHRIDHKEARNTTMHIFIESRHSENVRKEYREMVASVQSAWNLVRGKLKDHAQLRVEDEYLQHSLSLETTLDHFIPTTTGPGACTFALVHYLTYVHNNFIDWCRAKSKTSTWQEHKIQLPHIHTCHLLDYYTQLQSILLSHCHYSLRMGHGHEVSYDLPALQKHILDRFIHGKPRILVDIPQVSYRKDVYTAATFAAVRKKVTQQIALRPRVQMDILRELGSPDKLRKSLDVVEIVLGFLTSGGGKPKTRLVSYLKKLKMEKKTFSEKAKEHCNLEHILSLWQTLSVGLARVITLSGQEPFHTLNVELLEPISELQCKQLDEALPKFDLDTLLGTLYEFIETYIRHIDMGKKEWGLQDTLPPHLESNNLEVQPELGELPDDITLAQTVAAWKYIVHFQAKQRQD